MTAANPRASGYGRGEALYIRSTGEATASPPFAGLEVVLARTTVPQMESRKQSPVRIRPKNQTRSAPKAAQCVCVFTAIDGTLLDSRTFEAGASRAVIHRLHAAAVPVIPMSVMTLEEITPIAADLEFR